MGCPLGRDGLSLRLGLVVCCITKCFHMKYNYYTNDAATYQILLEKAKAMRSNPTEAESVLWRYISGGRLGVHFRRQHPVFDYIPGFVCLAYRLIIEIDGGYHLDGEQPEKDAERTNRQAEQGFTVLRFTNEEVLHDTDEVVDAIGDAIDRQQLELSGGTGKSMSSPLPSGGLGWVGRESVTRVGLGYDVHRLVEGRDLWLGGIKIEHTMGLLGHSDADVLIHAICDALLGAANMRDIGYHFPDTSADTLNVDSKILLRKTVELIATEGYTVGNIDATVCAERPKINPHVPAMKACLARVMGIAEDQISIKATTTERLGFTGREEGMSAYAVALIER